MALTIASGGLYVKIGRKFFLTTSTVEEFDAMKRELRRLRIAHLRRMAELAMEWADFTRPMAQRGKLYRFAKRCDNEIARLRAEA